MILAVVVMFTAVRGEVRRGSNLLAAGVTAALFILRRTPSDSAGHRSEEGCIPLITASVINSFIREDGRHSSHFLLAPTSTHATENSPRKHRHG